jgi:hypothetical protein
MIPYIPGGLEGLTKGLGQSLEEQQQQKFKMALMSSQIEQQANARKEEMQQQSELNKIPGEQVGTLAGLMGVPQDKIDLLQGMRLPSNVAASALAGIGAGNRIPQDMPVKTGVDANGQDVYSIFNKKLGQWQSAPQPLNRGLNQKAADEIATSRKAYGEINGILDSVDDLSKRVISAAGASGLPAQLVTNKVNQYLQGDQGAAKIYNDELLGHVQRYEKLITGNGRLNSDLVHGAISGMPNILTDTQATREGKLATLRGLNTNMLSSAYTAWNQPLPGDLLAEHGADRNMSDHFNAGFKQGTQSASDAAKQAYLQSLNQQFGQQNGKSK